MTADARTTGSRLALTPRGATTLAGAAAAGVTAWLLGLPELSVVAVAAASLVLVGGARAMTRNVPLDVRRVARPSRIQAGGTCEIRLVVANRGRRASPVVELVDDVGPFGTARLLLAPIPRGGTTLATYSLPADRRGVHHVGPLTTTLQDPFGLVRRSRVDARRTTVVVTPRTWALTSLPPAPGDEPDHGTHSLTTASSLDEEFAALRDYVPGDDVRRIHWRSSARRGTPVVRQFDVPWQHRTTIIADLRTDRHDDASFERLMSVLASLLELAARRDELVRVLTTDETSGTFTPAAEVLDAQLERLAVLRPSASRTTPDEVVKWLAQRAGPHGGRLVTCVGGLEADEPSRLASAGRAHPLHVVVSTRGGRSGVSIPGAHLVEWDGSVDLDEAWGPVVLAARRGVRA